MGLRLHVRGRQRRSSARTASSCKGLPDTYGTTGVPLLAFWVFQFAFADTCSTITSGAMVGRCGFVGDILYSIGVTGFIYPIIGHWAWGPDGWLAVMTTPFHDFAGSTVVHTIGGAISLAGAIALGPRLGRVFKRDGGGPMLPHNIILGAVGGLILWFGWYGFNPGSTLSALDAAGHRPRVVQHDDGRLLGRPDRAVLSPTSAAGSGTSALTTNGFLAGLVAITCPCYWVSPIGAFFIGIVGGGRRWSGPSTLLEYLRIDDPIGAVPVHMVVRHLGHAVARPVRHRRVRRCRRRRAPTRSTRRHGPVLRRRHRHSSMAQAIGSGVGRAGDASSSSMVLMYAVKATGTLRVSREGELEGLDLHEHGAAAYPEFVTMRADRPSVDVSTIVGAPPSRVAVPTA